MQAPSNGNSSLPGYGLAAVALLGAYGAIEIARPIIGSDLFFLPFIFAVLIAAAYGGFGPGLFATLTAAVLNIFLTVAPGSLGADREALSRIVLFGIIGIFVSGLGEGRRRALVSEFRQRQWLQTTMASMGDAAVVTDARGHVVMMNRVAEDVMKFRLHEALGRPLSDVFRIVNEQTRAAVEDPAVRVLHTGASVGPANHALLLRPDGSEIPIDNGAAPVFGADGSITGVVLLFRDVRDRRMAEREVEPRGQH